MRKDKFAEKNIMRHPNHQSWQFDDKIQIRAVSDDDLPIFFEHQCDSEANLMAAFPARDKGAFMSHWKNKIMGNSASLKKTITYQENVAGNILCWEQDGKWLIGYWIGREYWGKGIATNALKKFLQMLKTRPLYAYVTKENKGSMNVLQKCGFVVLTQELIFSTVHGRDVEEVLLICN